MPAIDPKYTKIITQTVIKEVTKKPRSTNYYITLAVTALFLLFLSYIVPKILDNFNKPTSQTATPTSETSVVNSSINLDQVFVIKRVVDGDTVELENGERVRYLNIDTPESVKPNVPPMCYSKEAAKKNEELLGNKRVKLTFDKRKTDRYGRLLAFVFPENTIDFDIKNSINAKLVESGYAKGYYLSPNTTYKKLFIELEQVAQSQKVGVWGACPVPFEQ